MKLAIIGLGKMGTLIETIAKQRGHETLSIDPHNPQADYTDVNAAPLGQCDCCIEFSHPSVVVNSIKSVITSAVPIVVGTTGWDTEQEAIQRFVKEKNGTLLYSSNFSIGVQVFSKIMQHAARLLNAFEQYDVAGFEAHHREKADSPSGTARTLADILLAECSRKDSILFGAPDRKVNANELQFSSVRCGAIPGTHSIHFDSEVDNITLSHTARNREGFAVGAVLAAEWLRSKKGFFTIDDLINEALGASL